MARRPTAARLGILRAMLSRSAPLIRGRRHWFVRGWAVTVRAVDVDALLADAWVASPTEAARGSPQLLVLTAAGRALAAAEAARSHPPTHAEDATA